MLPVSLTRVVGIATVQTMCSVTNVVHMKLCHRLQDPTRVEMLETFFRVNFHPSYPTDTGFSDKCAVGDVEDGGPRM